MLTKVPLGMLRNQQQQAALDAGLPTEGQAGCHLLILRSSQVA